MADNENVSPEKKSSCDLSLPISRVRTIMKSSPDVENISQDALYAVTAVTEIFIRSLAANVYSCKDEGSHTLTYNDLAEFVNSQNEYKFLDEIVPKKVSGRDILAARTAETNKEDNSKEEDEENADKGEGESGEESNNEEEEENNEDESS